MADLVGCAGIDERGSVTNSSNGIRLTVIAGVMLVLMASGAFVVSRLPGKSARQPNLVLIVLDTVRYDKTSLAGGIGRPDTTPFLRQLASRGVSFSRARSNAEWTVPAHASMFTGLSPSAHGAHFAHRYLGEEVTTVAEALQRDDYVTAAFSSNVNVSRAFNFDQGFDDFFEAFHEESVLVHGSRSAAVLSALGKWVSEHSSGPRFIFINLMEAHLPYSAAPEHLETLAPHAKSLAVDELGAADFLDRVVAGERKLDPEFQSMLASRYDAALRTVDDRLREVVELLESKGVLGPDSVLVVTSDHGEHLGENGLVDHHGALSEALLRVPLVYVGRGVEPGVVNDQPIATDSIARFLPASVIGGFKPAQYRAPLTPIVAERWPAYSIVERLRSRVEAVDDHFLALGEIAIVDPSGRFKLCIRDDGLERLFAIDPTSVAETLLDAAAEPDLRNLLRQQIAKHRARAQPPVERFKPERHDAVDGEFNAELSVLAQSGYGAPATRGSGGTLHAQIHLERGNRAFAAGDFANARAEYDGAARLDGKFAAPLFNLAVVSEKSGATVAEQIAAWERYLAVALRGDVEDRAKLDQAYARLEILRGTAPHR